MSKVLITTTNDNLAPNLAEGKDRYIQDPALYKTEWQDFSSYYNMPYYLRLCFLYLGIFPHKSKFSVSKLTHMWIAEGFIPRRPTVTMEKTAQECLKDLIHRNLVKVEEKRLDGSAYVRSLVRVDTLKLSHIASPKEEFKWSRFFQQPRLPLSLSSLLQPSQLPPTLSSLTLSATSLNWQHISVLGSLETLKELKLKNNAFVGEKWEVSGKGFPHLRTLHIECVDFIQWRASSGQFQQLRRLMLSECKELREIPIELANVRTFGELHLHNCNKSAAESARKIDVEKQRKQRTDSSTVFMLFT